MSARKNPLRVAAFAIFALPALVTGQSSVSTPAVSGPLPSIGLPLERIGLPLPRIGLPLPFAASEVSERSVLPPNHRRSHRRQGVRSGLTVVYVVPAFVWDNALAAQPAPSAVEPASKREEQKPQTGRFRLDVKPEGGLQIHVDGYYVGSSEDFKGELELEAGPHTIAIGAPEHETLHLDVQVTPHQSITYRGALKPIDTTADPDPVRPTTFYFIPGCYIGNVPPKDAGLPPTCDQSRVITFDR